MSDTLRQDHLGCYGNENIITPYIDQFSNSCIKFNRAYATSFPTMPCRADLFTGKYTFTYLGWNPITDEETVLAEILQKAGYTTLAAVDTPFLMRDGYGYDRGFDDFVFISGQDPGYDRRRVISSWRYEDDYFSPRTIAAAEKLLEYYYKEKFFLYIDMWDPHEPWDPPEYYVKQYRPNYNGEDHVIPTYWDWKEAGLTEEDVKLCHDCYCGEVTMVDRWVGRLLDKVKKLGIWDDTAIIFTADHGFCFGEHGLLGKARQNTATFMNYNIPCKELYDNPKELKNVMGKSVWMRSPLYQELTKVPLLFYIPGLESKKSEKLVSCVDIMPTILELAGIEPPDSVQGKSIKPLIEGKIDSIRDFVLTSYPIYNVGDKTRMIGGGVLKRVKEVLPITITDKTWTMFYSGSSTPIELYNIKDDPKQLKNIFDKNKEVVRGLYNKLFKLLEQLGTSKHLLDAIR